MGNSFTHITVHAADIERSARFYEELFDMERIATPNFGVPVVFLQLGAVQLHLGDLGQEQTGLHHHFGIGVSSEELVRIYRYAADAGILDASFGTAARLHPAGWIQMWLRDPSGNLVEVDCREVRAEDAEQIEALTHFEDEQPQVGAHRTATVFSAPEQS